MLGALSLEKHPDKTFIGRIERGFDFLGYHFSPGLTVARKTMANFIEKASRLYEQKRRTGSAATPLEMYVRRWTRWAGSGLGRSFFFPEGPVLVMERSGLLARRRPSVGVRDPGTPMSSAHLD